jgi:hypothetical protein
MRLRLATTTLALLLCWPPALLATDVEPRLFSNIPVGVSFLGLGYAYSKGSVATDASLPVQDAEVELNTFTFSLSHAFELFGKSATATIALPYINLEATGIVFDEPASREFTEFGDPIIKLGYNFYGAPALTPKEFRSYRQKTIVAANLLIRPPWGQYDEDFVINAGANRWTIAPEIGVSHRHERFTFEASAGSLWFSDNEDLLGESTLSQDLMYILRSNVLYHFKSNLWIGFGGSYLYGGKTSVDSVKRDDLQKRSRLGAALSVPLAPGHALRLKFTSGLTTRLGADFNTVSLTYTYRIR